jgi:hypothetical protein
MGVLILALLLTGTQVSTAQAATTGDAGRRLLYEIESGTHDWTDAQAIQHARLYDVIVALAHSYSPSQVTAMRRASPGLTILVYTNGTLAQTDEKNAFPESWYIRDPAGNKIQNDWNLWLMNPSNSGWLANRLDQCRRFVSATTFDGCYLDNMGYGFLQYNLLTGTPINPQTGKRWTNQEWLTATTALTKTVASQMSQPVVPNGLVDGAAYFGSPSSSSLLSVADMALAEVFVRTSRQGVNEFPSVPAWKQDLDMVADAARRGKPVLLTTKVWTSATDAQKRRWHEFALATFLLGTGGRSAFHFSGTRYESPTVASTLDTVYLGAPVGGYTTSSGAYQRAFQNGKALVNPTSSAVTVSLGGRYRLPNGTVVTSVRLGPSTGMVLPKA